MINYLKERAGLIFFYSVIAIMILLMNVRFTDLNAQKNSTDSQHEIADISTR